MFSTHELSLLADMMDQFALDCKIEYEKSLFELGRLQALDPDGDYTSEELEVKECKRYHDIVKDMADLVLQRFNDRLISDYDVFVVDDGLPF